MTALGIRVPLIEGVRVTKIVLDDCRRLLVYQDIFESRAPGALLDSDVVIHFKHYYSTLRIFKIYSSMYINKKALVDSIPSSEPLRTGHSYL